MTAVVLFERSGVVREALRRRSVDAWSCDTEPAEDGSPYHYQQDALTLLYAGRWDLVIAHPPCTYLCSSGLHWNRRRPGRADLTAVAVDTVRRILNAPHIDRIALENPVGRIGQAIRPADQYIQPWQFGHDASKRTGLWLKNLPRLVPTGIIAPRLVCCGERVPVDGLCATCGGRKRPKERWANQTDSGQNRLAPSDTRSMDRARTYQGIADAMASQWVRAIWECAA